MSKKSKIVKQREAVNIAKNPRAIENPESFYGKHPVWSFKRLDNNYVKWGLVHSDDINRDVIKKLVDFEGMTWKEIFEASGGKTKGHGNNSHFENVSSLIAEAQKRWIDLKLEQYDRVLSLRLTNVMRLYGILSDGVLQIIWFDQRHEICPSKK